MALPAHIKRELLNMTDQIEMAEKSGDEVRLNAVLDAVEKRLDAIERDYPVEEVKGFQSRLGSFRNGLF